MHFVYILYSRKLDKYYIGCTKDISARIRKHNAEHRGFTDAGRPWSLVHVEEYSSKTLAHKRELQLKAWKNRKRIEALFVNGSEHPD
jgi:putative endonuclease